MRRPLFPLLLGLVAIVVLAAVHSRAYSLSGHYWGKTNVSFYVNPVNKDMSQQAAIAAIQAAAANWSEQSSANVKLVYAGTTTGSSLVKNGKNEVFFRNSTSGGTIGASYYWYGSDGRLIDADVIFYDAAYRFFPGASGCSGGHYAEDIATHEFGHALGFYHSTVTSATMYPTLSTWCSMSWRSLASDDVSAIQKAYPPLSSSTSTTTLPATPTLYLPVNLATGVTNTVTNGSYVRWYTAARATSYDVYFGTSSNPPKIATVTPPAGMSVWRPGTMYQAVTKAAHTTYYWRVVAKNSAGSASSAIRKFTTL
jgi:Matrixin